VPVNNQDGISIVVNEETPTVSISLQQSSSLNVQNKQKMSVSVINPNEYIYQEGAEAVNWGSILGTLTNQTDLVNYINTQVSKLIESKTRTERLEMQNLTVPTFVYQTDGGEEQEGLYVYKSTGWVKI
jgi:lipopolysaccharide export system protein LptC